MAKLAYKRLRLRGDGKIGRETLPKEKMPPINEPDRG